MYALLIFMYIFSMFNVEFIKDFLKRTVSVISVTVQDIVRTKPCLQNIFHIINKIID